MKSKVMAIVSVLLLHVGSARAGSIEGFVVDLNGNKVGGVTVEAFEVNAQGVRNRTPFNSTVSDTTPGANLGKYMLDLRNNPRVVLLFSGGGSNDVFVPQPQQANANIGGAMSGLNDIRGFDVVVPEAKPRSKPCSCCCRRWRRCR